MGASNPFNSSNWLLHDSNGGDDAGDDIELGEFNQLTSGDAGNATIVQNSANQNVALVGQNIADGGGVVGVYGESDGAGGGDIGVAGACDKGWGVAGIATTPNLDPSGFPGSVGTFGAGDVVGIYGQSRPKESQLPITLPPPSPGTGVYGAGDVVGVEGDCDGKGTGVIGESVAGKGVIGDSVSAADIGVYGQSTASSPTSLPVSPGTGVFGTGDSIGMAGTSFSGRGGVFSTGSPTHPPVAQAQLVPVLVPIADTASVAPPRQDPPPRLPRLGQAGDLLAVSLPPGNAAPLS